MPRILHATCLDVARALLRAGVFGLAAMLAIAPIARAEPAPSGNSGLASAWDGPTSGKARLIAGGGRTPSMGAVNMAGVHIVLQPGWKTYWRIPGESGVPPVFTWSGSDNLRKATVLYPAPMRIEQGGMTSLGYGDEVVFPVLVEPIDPSRPVQLQLTLEYGVCKDICMPATARFTLSVPGGRLPPDPLLAKHLARVPWSAVTGDAHVVALRLAPASRRSNTGPRLIVETRFPGGAASADLLIEATGGGYVPLPKAVQRSGERAVFEVRFATQADADRVVVNPFRATLISTKGQCSQTIALPRS